MEHYSTVYQGVTEERIRSLLAEKLMQAYIEIAERKPILKHHGIIATVLSAKIKEMGYNSSELNAALAIGLGMMAL